MQSHLLMIGITSTLLLIKKNKSKEKSIVEKQTYSYEEAYEESLRYFQGDELAARVWVNKYAVKDSFGNIYEKSPKDMHWRIANEVARIEILGGIVLCVISAKFYGYSLKDRFTDIIKPIINSIIMCFILSMAHLEFSLDIITIIVKLFVGLLLYLILCVITKDKNIRQLIRFSRKLH